MQISGKSHCNSPQFEGYSSFLHARLDSVAIPPVNSGMRSETGRLDQFLIDLAENIAPCRALARIHPARLHERTAVISRHGADRSKRLFDPLHCLAEGLNEVEIQINGRVVQSQQTRWSGKSSALRPGEFIYELTTFAFVRGLEQVGSRIRSRANRRAPPRFVTHSWRKAT